MVTEIDYSVGVSLFVGLGFAHLLDNSFLPNEVLTIGARRQLVN